MKKGCLARGLATLFFLCTLGLGGATYYLWGQNTDLQGQLTQARAQIAADAAAGPGRHRGPKRTATSDYLSEAQTDVNQAAQDIKSHDVVGAGEEAVSAVQALAKAPKKMSTDAQAQYNSINKQVSGIEQQIAKVRDDASSEYRKLTSLAGG